MRFQKLLVGSGLAVAMMGGIFIGEAFAAQPHMRAALDALETARNQLEMSTPNKGGHRERAIELVRQAIEEVRSGMDYAH
ncbi:MAG: hypothetical protein JSR60_12425 [Proteobacteria bacterium]|nr:hypothetical protein [Pseudomonadota bacterium]